MNELTDRQSLAQSLRDAGCSEDFIQAFLQAVDKGQSKEQLRLLASWRAKLLDSIHAEQRKLDCLDYLRYLLQKQAKASK